MYVCVCNAIRESQVLGVIRVEGACTPGEIFRALDAKPVCGKCIPDMERLLKAEGLGPDCRSCATGCALGRQAS